MKLQFVVLCLVISSAAAAASIRLVGGWTPIKNLKDPHVVEIAQFAVSEYNKQVSEVHKLKLESIEKGETQVVAGTNYRLLLVAEEGVAKDKYDAVVWEKLGSGDVKELKSFSPHN